MIYSPLTKGEYYRRPDAIEGCCSELKPPPLLLTSTKSAEIIKHASNAFLALKISFINAVSNLCEAADANVEQVAQGIGLDSRIGPKFLRPGIGYGGSCFPKDVAAFRSVAEQMGVDFSLLGEVEKINSNQKKRFLSKVRSALWTLRGKRLAVLGLAFKGDTDDIRESPAIDLVEMLLAEGCTVVAYDPAAMKRAQSELPPSGQMIYVTGIEEAAKDADALLILTDWREFARIDLRQLHAIMRYPIIIDGRNLYDPQDMVNNDFTYLSIGRPAATPSREPAVLAV
jgi:UDPglucose 6-dehydrogenase